METTYRVGEMKNIEGREIAALLNPRLALLVTCCDLDGAPNALTVAWHTPLSHDPPLLGISINRRHHSHELIRLGRDFVVNVVSMEMQAAVELCGSQSGRDLDKLHAAGLTTRPATQVRSPLIAGAPAWLECALVDQVAVGDHTFFIGRVLAAQARRDYFSDAWQPAGEDVLLCLQRDRFVTWTSG